MGKLGNGVIPSVFSRIFQILRSPTHHLFSLILRMNRPHAIAAAADNQVLESTLLYILSCINPVAEDRLRRQRTLDDLALLIRNVPTFKDTTIRPFGSFVSGIYSKWGDLDISLNLPTNSNAADSNTKKLKLRALRKLMHVVKNRSFGIHVEFIPSARVPILKFKSRRYNIECDISVDNHVGLSKSTFLLWITQKDKRIHDLVLLIKEWAKAHKINDPKSRTLNSYSLCLLVIFHLQTCEPAILPPLREIFGFTNLCDVIGIERTSQRYMHAYIASIASYRSSNRSSLSKLLISFFEKFSDIRLMSSRYVICTYTGQWEPIWRGRWAGMSYPLIVEDPWEQPENAARAVASLEFEDISSAFNTTNDRLKLHYAPSQKSHLLRCLARPSITHHLQQQPNNGQNRLLFDFQRDAPSSSH